MNLLSHLYSCGILGKSILDGDDETATEAMMNDTALADAKVKPMPSPSPPRTLVRNYGTMGCGYETMTQAWSALHHAWSFGGAPSNPNYHTKAPNWPKSSWVEQHPVDLWIVDQGSKTVKDMKEQRHPDRWLALAQSLTKTGRPRLVIESWPSQCVGWTYSPLNKQRRLKWEDIGYVTHTKLIRADTCGGAIRQSRVIIVRAIKELSADWKWSNEIGQQLPRPMSNLLIPKGLLPPAARRVTLTKNLSYTVPQSWLDPMPTGVGAYVEVEKGVARKLQSAEIAKALGCSLKNDTGGELVFRDSYLRHTTSGHIWEMLGESFTIRSPTTGTKPPAELLGPTIVPTEDHQCKQHLHEPFLWAPPDMAPQGPWYQQRMTNLKRASSKYPGQEAQLVEQGKRLLKIHRSNYDMTGAKANQLQLLWWEFPQESWDDLREGCRMNFLTEPEHVMHPNADMDPEQVEVASQFVDELIDIGAVREPRLDDPPVTNTPLFCVEKPGQPGEWRVIADCKAGGQNAHMGNDPVYLNRPLHILEQMYPGGYTAIVDASKFFYQFPVHPDDQKYLGLVHPKTGKNYVWHGCPMGTGTSPGIAGRHGLAFVRLLREHGRLYQKGAHPNCWWTGFREEGYDPNLGYGFSYFREDGKPAIRIWVHVDDFAIHGPDYESTTEALKYFLDLTVSVGLLCHPKKLKPPSQVQTYVGFEFDCRGTPTLRIPEAKRERALAMAEYLASIPTDKEVSRLVLAVIIGTLESLVDATPRRLGHTNLRASHTLIHEDSTKSGVDVYYTRTTVPQGVKQEMKWWISALNDSRGYKSRMDRSHVLIPSWGDGSGTGTGGTIDPPGMEMKMWMGQWAPHVFKFSSNWKELKTLGLTLQNLLSMDPNSYRGTTVFYFTDNSATYWVCQKGSSSSEGLHALTAEILDLAWRMEIELQVVHVPGRIMIVQGTDGLSRGVWANPLHALKDPQELHQAVFSPIPQDPSLVTRILHKHNLPGPFKIHDWARHWGRDLFDHLSVWFPPPELARQCLIGILEAWVERPQTTSALLFIPRVVTGNWIGLCRFLRELEVLYPHTEPLNRPAKLDIPVVVLYLPPHTRLLPKHRMERTAYPRGYKAHQREAEGVRRLQMPL